MAFVKTSRFPLPTVTRADGTLGGYVQASPITSGPQFIWPATRVQIYQQQLAAAKAAAQKKKLFNIFDIFGGSKSAVPSNIKSKAVQPSAPGKSAGARSTASMKSTASTKSLGDDGSGNIVLDDGSVISPNGTTTLPTGTVIAPNGQTTQNSLLQVGANLLATTAAAGASASAAKKNAAAQPQAPASSSGISMTTLGIGAAALAALVIGVAAGGRRR